jgi:uncharacterized membrane-anchored protein
MSICFGPQFVIQAPFGMFAAWPGRMTIPADTAARATARPSLVRVPAITAWFWLVKILTTGAGESTSDYLGRNYPHAIVGGVGAVALVGSLWLQMRMHRYVAWTYWLAVSMVAIVGTMFADVVHSLGISYLLSTLLLSIALAAIFVAWHRTEGTLSIHSITHARRERFYWGAVMITFALGTAAGDMTATTFHWGYLGSGVAFTIAILAIWLAHVLVSRARGGGQGRAVGEGVLAFWLAYILTRPLGASYADWMGEPRAKGGLEWGGGTVSVIMFIVIIVLVAFLAKTRIDVQREPAE